MANFVMLEYTFMFDPTVTWHHLYEFEKDISNFFAEFGYDAEIVKTVEGSPAKRLLLIKRKATILDNAIQNLPQTDSKKVLDQMRNKLPTQDEKKFKQGKMNWKQGYLKK